MLFVSEHSATDAIALGVRYRSNKHSRNLYTGASRRKPKQQHATRRHSVASMTPPPPPIWHPRDKHAITSAPASTCRRSGGLYSIECGNVLITGNASLIGNSASVDGGAMLISTPGELHIDSATFERNKALSGGAVALFATAPATYLDLIVTLCTFEANYATNGGALYLFNSAHGVSVAKSVFLENVAGERLSCGNVSA